MSAFVIKTGSWKTYTGPGRIGIALGSPRGVLAGYRLYRTLAPTKDMLRMGLEEYTPAYQAILDKLDPEEIAKNLTHLAGGFVPVMMCFEHPDDIAAGTTFCHRHMAARWLEKHLGITIEEVRSPGR